LFLLGIDTSVKRGIVCLGEKEKMITQKILSPHSSSQQLLPSLDILMKERGKKIQDLEGIVITLGPGSFTGLRIGLSLAKSLAFTLKIPLVGIPAFDAWVASFPGQGIICPLLQAYGNKFYAAFYRKDERKVGRKSKYLFSSWEEIEKRISKRFPSQKITFLALEEQENLFNQMKSLEDYSLFLLRETEHLENLLKLGAEKIESKKIDNIFTLVPLYTSSPRIKKRGK
jgi:tRNA threonylcarbamoyladenosine biosynthesis protein TsaB